MDYSLHNIRHFKTLNY